MDSYRQARTRSLIQVGGLVHKAGILEALCIEAGDDLQSPESREKAAQLLGFLTDALKKTTLCEEEIQRWEELGTQKSKSRIPM
jgi:hypothetical protein